MNPGQTEKLTGLIQISAILIPVERAEWLTLLDLMNDKQQAELEKILTTGIKNPSVAKAIEDKHESPKQTPGDATGQVGIKAQTKAPAPVIVPPKPASVEADKAPMHMPPLSHIMNLPNLQRSSYNLQRTGLQKTPALHPLAGGPSINLLKNVKTSLPPAVNSRTIKSEADVKKNGFLNRLKQILTEKELPAGRPGPELELTGGQPQKTVVPAPIQFKEKPKPPVPPVALGQNTALKKAEEPKPFVAPALPKTEPVILSKIAPIASAQKPADVEKIQAILRQTATVQSRSSIVDSGLAFSKPVNENQNTTLEAIRKHVEASSQISSETLSKTLSQVELNVKDLNDLALLKPKNLENINLPNAVKKVKGLIGRSGYFDVLFALEKSEAYKVYIQTGLELLSRQMDFEKMEEAEPAGKFMNRDQFEKIADLLRQIQAA